MSSLSPFIDRRPHLERGRTAALAAETLLGDELAEDFDRQFVLNARAPKDRAVPGAGVGVGVLTAVASDARSGALRSNPAAKAAASVPAAWRASAGRRHSVHNCTA